MAHNISFNESTGKYSFFSVKEKAWHGLGQIVSDYPTSAEAMKFAGLDYEVIKQPLFTHNRSISVGNAGEIIDGRDIAVPDYFATLRTDNDKVLGVVGKDYEIVQNREAFDFFDAIVGGGDGIQYETAGSLGNGEVVFITAKLPGYIRVGSDDLIEKYLFLTTTHDGSGSITAAFTPIRIVCANTLRMAMGNHTNAIKIRHTASAAARLKEAHKLMGITNTLAADMEAIMNNWTKVRITDKEVRRLIELALAPNAETTKLIRQDLRDELSTRFTNQTDNAFSYAMLNETQQMETTKGTLFGAFNAVTGFYQNVMDYKDNEAKVKSLYYDGTAQKRTQAAFSLCADFAKHGSEVLFN